LPVHDADLVRHELAEIEADTELHDHGDVATRRHGLHEGFPARLRDGAQVVDELVFRHADAGMHDDEGGQDDESSMDGLK